MKIGKDILRSSECASVSVVSSPSMDTGRSTGTNVEKNEVGNENTDMSKTNKIKREPAIVPVSSRYQM